FSLLALSGLMEALRTASCVQKSRQKIAFKLSLISTRAELPITSSAGISVQPEAAHLTPGEYDYIAVIGGSLEDLDKGLQDDRAFLAEAHHNAIPLIGIGTGSFILAEEEILNERRASIHPYHHDVLGQPGGAKRACQVLFDDHDRSAQPRVRDQRNIGRPWGSNIVR
ncbi:DJ-1/PfpI family protein, partial [Escherichia coli]|uniref:DJ-1/PfpI family protein n=1 Tax=Escherichia coli TaxID=562 RepID=UPI002FE2AF6F